MLAAPWVQVTPQTFEKAVQQIAKACALGHVQQAAVQELINTGGLMARRVQVPVWKAGRQQEVTVYGDARLTTPSWRNLKKRLTRAGFTFIIKNNTVHMVWSD